MNTRLRILLLIPLAALGGFAFSRKSEVVVARAPSQTEIPAAEGTEIHLVRIADATPLPATQHGSRNLFAFDTPPARPIEPVIAPASAPLLPEPIITSTPQPSPTQPQVPEVPYRLIGTFGREADPIAAVVGQGNVVTVQRGGAIDGRYAVEKVDTHSLSLQDDAGPPRTLVIP